MWELQDEAALFLNKCREGTGLVNFKVTQAALIAFLNDSAHYFQLYSSPLHGALPYPYRAPVLLAQAWHVFNKPLEPECRMKSPGSNFKDSSVFSALTREPRACQRHPSPPHSAKGVVYWPRAWMYMRQSEGDK